MIMKRIFSIVLILLLCAATIAALAEAAPAAELDHITDDAGIFNDDELEMYENWARAISDEYQCGVYFATTEDYTQNADGEIDEVAEYIYKVCHLGYGENKDGVLMLVSTAEGNCAVVSQGTALDALGDQQLLLDECVDAYGENGYRDMLDAFLDRTQTAFAAGFARPTNAMPKRNAAYIDLDGYVTDVYGLLTADQESALEGKAAELSGKYGCGVYIIIVDDYLQYGKGSPYDVAGDVFLACDLGEGPDNAGVLLMMSMADRDVTILTNEGGHAMIGPDAKDWLAVKYLKFFKKNAWAEGYETYLSKLETVLKMAAQGKPMTWITYPESTLFGVLVASLGGLGISYFLLSIFRDRMKSVFKAASADNYIAQGGVAITASSDTFSHRTTTRQKVESSSSSGGRSGGSRGSDHRGFSGRSDKF